MSKNKEHAKSQTAFIRSDGWVISADGMRRLEDSGRKGHELFMASIRNQIGEWHRVNKPLDRDAADIVMSVKGLVARAIFVSRAIVDEAERRAKGE
ncbi:MAG: hypothetical protein J6Q22_09475 [Prevotella sp.]|nr:hypothetical protein [Prevotella sp.]